MKKVIFRGIASNFYAQIVTLFVQIFSVPIMLKYWGVNVYATWLVISAIPSYLSLTNLGVGNAANSALVMLSGKGIGVSSKEGSSIISTTFFLLSSILSIGLTILIILYSCRQLILNIFDVEESTLIALLILMLYTLLNFFGSLWDGIFAAKNMYATSNVVNSNKRLVEFLIVLCVIYNGGNLLDVSLSMFIFNLIYQSSILFVLARVFQFRLSIKSFKLETIKELFHPSLGYMAMPAGFALFVQGSTIIASTLSSSFVVLFNTTRTIVSVGRQLFAAVSHTYKPQISRAIGELKYDKVKRYMILSLLQGSALSCLFYILVLLFGENIYNIWTGGEVQFNSMLVLILCSSSFIASLWHQGYVFLSSANKHTKFSILFLIVAVFNFITMYALSNYSISHILIISVLVLSDLLILIISFVQVRKVFR